MDPMYASLFPARVSSHPQMETRVVITTTTLHIFLNTNSGIEEVTFPFDPDSLPPSYPRAAFTLRTLDPQTPEVTVTPGGGCGCGSPLKSMSLPQVVQMSWPAPQPASAP